MPRTQCITCHNDYDWSWTEAFDKFGFGDGDGQVMTATVADVLEHAGYDVDYEPWGLHNEVITSIKLHDVEQIPLGLITLGYDDPREYLPPAINTLLDDKLPDVREVAS